MNIRSLLQVLAPRKERRLVFLLSLLVLLVTWVIPLWFLRDVVPSGELLPLHYNVHLGVDYAGPWYASLFFPAFATIVLIVNTGLAIWMRKYSPLLANTLSVAALFIGLFTALALFFVLVLNA
ncbi:hypothetical protein COV06_03845 [Candidatus Uhrbacteria bacterium CG10_big_fil_rev_8_21_14_0_10_50_16]|uniref:DUF1648 domain-containing protein n=1 Tax=Candidatus Uhrbacteria bacterium CG10_big_fil_rev_8_21_14_0_10_50_16 TaxID=1975039 RepID=A0A2H0RNP2_9BACT|nr:MAG: hypothetical protein COV06_03845 [Candidatus Uhrbacteria bacterium CG10_big_fil_rev_8_21_14_0_10_50_16]